jgi:hypothetical protein
MKYTQEKKNAKNFTLTFEYTCIFNYLKTAKLMARVNLDLHVYMSVDAEIYGID